MTRVTSQPDDPVCAITLVPIKDLQHPLETRCGHIFERAALSQWVQRNNICPVCRAIYPLSPFLAWIRNIDTAARRRIAAIAPRPNPLNSFFDSLSEGWNRFRTEVTSFFAPSHPLSDEERLQRIENFIRSGDLRSAEREVPKIGHGCVQSTACERIVVAYLHRLKTNSSNLRNALRLTQQIHSTETKNNFFSYIATRQLSILELRSAINTISLISDNKMRNILYCKIPFTLLVKGVVDLCKNFIKLLN